MIITLLQKEKALHRKTDAGPFIKVNLVYRAALITFLTAALFPWVTCIK